MRRGIEADVNVGLLPYRYGTDRSNLECWRLPGRPPGRRLPVRYLLDEC